VFLYENRPKEQIAYNLAFYGEDAETRSSIIRVLYQLPEDVVIFALDRCSFVSVGKAASGMVLPGKIGVHSQKKRSRNCWLIILDERSTDDESVIAHEIAHAWLGHDRISAYDTETWEIDAAI
jgi:hypothetical protein